MMDFKILMTKILTAIKSLDTSKVDKISGKGLSTNDYTTTEKNKLAGIAAGAEVNQNAFSNVKVGSTTVAADGKIDTLELVAGDNITLTPDATNDKVTIIATDTTYTPASATPKMDGTGAVGTSAKYAREDHVHPVDTSRMAASLLTRLLRSEVSADDLNGNADNAPNMSVVYISSGTVAASISNLPENTAGHLITIGGTGQRGYQFYLIHVDGIIIYARRQHTSFGAWYKLCQGAPSWTKPSVYSSRCTIGTGGYYRIGRRVYVEVTITPSAARNANTAYQYLSGLPAPSVERVPLAVSNSNNKGGYTAVITSSGGLSVINGSTGIASGESLVIGGTYLAAS